MTRLPLVSDPRAAPVCLSPLEAFQQELDYVFHNLRRLGAGPGDVDDMAHEVFLALRGSWHKYDPQRPVRPYLYGIMCRVAAGYRRKRDREVATPNLEIVDPAPTVDERLDAVRGRRIVLAALQRIPLPQRAVLIRHDIEGVPVADIARDLAIPLFTAYSRLRRGRQQFLVAARRMLSRERSWTRSPTPQK
ncbi:MAG TPA: RNA polymerase sigma factor [Polyangia bacterium]|nr:RNA polymerase sigma factor [Polyangia bacterium]